MDTIWPVASGARNDSFLRLTESQKYYLCIQDHMKSGGMDVVVREL